MKENIIEILTNLSFIDEHWEEQLKLLAKEVQHIHPDIYELLQCNTIEDTYHIIVNYKPLILDPIKDKEQLKIFYNDIIDYNVDNHSWEEMIYFLELAFGEFNSDYIFYPKEIEESRDKNDFFTFEEFYILWQEHKLK